MISEDRDISCYTTSLITNYAVVRGISKELLFVGLEEFQTQLQNPLEWIDGKKVVRFFDNYVKASGGDVNVLEQTGLEIATSQLSHFQLLFLRIAPLSCISKTLQKHTENNISKSFSLNLELKGNGRAVLKTKRVAPEKYSKPICVYNKGCAIAIFKSKRLKNLQVVEKCCAADSESSSCIYEITWEPSPPLIEKILNVIYFRFTSQKAILSHMEESHLKLKDQYKETEAIKDFYSHIMANMSESVLWLESDGTISFANRSFLSLVGLNEDLVHGKRLDEFILNSTAISEYKKMCDHCIAEPDAPVTSELVINTSIGEERIGQTSITWVSSQHRSPGFLVCIRDVTASKKIQQKLFIAEDRYRALYENSPAIIIGLNITGNFIYANPAMIEQSGYSEQELLGMHFSALVTPNVEADLDLVLKTLINGQTRLQEVHFKTKCGDWKCAALNTYPIYDTNNKIAGCAGIGIDITETKRLNEQVIKAQRMDLLGQLAGGLAHDFNNLVSAITGYGMLIQMQSTEEKIKQFGETIGLAGKRATELVKNLLAFSRGDVGKTGKFDVNEIVSEVGKIMVGVATSSIAIKTEFLDGPQFVMGNSGKIHQCIMNLCMNAKDAIAMNSGVITIRVTNATSKPGFLWIQVEDTGGGIPPDIIEKIFDPFFTTKKKKEGTGLGLSVVYGIVKVHKGDIFVDSRPGEGTTFTIELPKHIENESKILKKTVLIIDSDELIRNYCAEILIGSGFHTIEFSTVTAATQWLKTNPEAAWVTLSDITMQDIDVKKFVSITRSIKNELKHIWMSGTFKTGDRELIKEDHCLQKPFTPTDLLQIIQSFSVTK